MFKASTTKIQELAYKQPKVIEQLERLLVERVNMYIDYANVRSWTPRLGWHIDLERLHQFLRSFDNITTISLYNGTLQGDLQSEVFIRKAERLGYRVKQSPLSL